MKNRILLDYLKLIYLEYSSAIGVFLSFLVLALMPVFYIIFTQEELLSETKISATVLMKSYREDGYRHMPLLYMETDSKNKVRLRVDSILHFKKQQRVCLKQLIYETRSQYIIVDDSAACE